MYWSRTGSALDLIAWLLQFALWGTGGWLLAIHAFKLRRGESLIAGLATGLLLFIIIGNLAAQVLPLAAAFWAAAALILALGAVTAWREPERFDVWKGELQAWPQLLVLAGLVTLFELINHGLAIFDDYHNLPLLSVIASGDVPPHFYLNTTQSMAYHYGLHLFAASLMRVGGLFPWSAFDLAKAFSLGLAGSLGWLWFRRITRSRLVGLLGGALALFGGGARWLLLFLPVAWLVHWGAGLHLLGSATATGPDLYSTLISPWKIEGAGPIPFPFAFANGIFPTLTLALSGSGALPQMTALLLLLLAQRRWRPLSATLFGLILASLALTGEHLFGMAWAGFLLAILLGWRSLRARKDLWLSGWILLSSAILALVQGGVITDIARGLLVKGSNAGSFGFAGFELRWPPALLSAHLGPLVLTQPTQVLIGLAEIGPVVLLGLILMVWTWKRARRGRWAEAGLAIGAAIGFFLPLFLKYGVERDISRMTGSALFIWMILGFALLWFALRRGRPLVQLLVGTGYVITVLGGLALFTPELVAISNPQLTYFVSEPDALMTRSTWDRLPEGTQVLDLNIPYRAITLLGRGGGRAYRDWYTPLPEWETLVAAPDPARFAQAGYSYVYLDKAAWQGLNPQQKQAFEQPCVRLASEQTTDQNDFRKLLDIQKCK